MDRIDFILLFICRTEAECREIDKIEIELKLNLYQMRLEVRYNKISDALHRDSENEAKKTERERQGERQTG